MNNDERDNMMIEMHRDVGVVCERLGSVCERIDEHHTTLYGPDGKDGVVEGLIKVKDRQDSCPAREATTGDGKRHRNEMMILVTVAILSLLTSVAIAIMN